MLNHLINEGTINLLTEKLGDKNWLNDSSVGDSGAGSGQSSILKITSGISQNTSMPLDRPAFSSSFVGEGEAGEATVFNELEVSQVLESFRSCGFEIFFLIITEVKIC